ncbi:MAG: TIGR03564 family F420-dependent LLM class oxidoreductase [Deltaproteobacteria bacterium]|nr:TIGR03564 family F420-dependent LLM class oxidoreductase [Deltaproteobacteria bacterium]
MRLGINGTGLVLRASIQAIVEDAEAAAADGFSSYWLAEHPTGGFDALTVLTVVGQQVPGIELGTAVVPTFPRHPMTLASQTLTTRSAIGDRLTLGIGLSHETMMAQLGIDFAKPIRHLREFLSILIPLLNEGKVSFDGEVLSCHAEIFRAPENPCPVVVAALGPQALRVAGARTQGTTLAWVGPRTVREHIAPTLGAAADAAGRPSPRIIATLPVCVTDETERIRELVGKLLAMYAELPSYRAMFDREGVDGPGDLALVGSEDQVREKLEELAAAGVTDFAASEFTTNDDERARTRALLKSTLTASAADS